MAIIFNYKKQHDEKPMKTYQQHYKTLLGHFPQNNKLKEQRYLKYALDKTKKNGPLFLVR